jgi:septal ring factor EnvC (AmiA/AmiB activator)
MSPRRPPGREPIFTLGNFMTAIFGLLGATGLYTAAVSNSAVTGQRVATAETDLAKLASDVTTARTSNTRAETRLDALEGRISAAERRIDQINDRLNTQGDRRR